MKERNITKSLHIPDLPIFDTCAMMFTTIISSFHFKFYKKLKIVFSPRDKKNGLADMSDMIRIQLIQGLRVVTIQEFSER